MKHDTSEERSGESSEDCGGDLQNTFDIDGKNHPSVFRKKAVDTITAINLFVTQTCNLRCIYCYGGGGEFGNKSHMVESCAFRTVDWLIEQSKEKKKLSICFFGGEPLMNFPLIKKVVAYGSDAAKKKNKTMEFGLLTNGTLIEDEHIRYFKEKKIAIQLSFDGPREIQDKQRPFKNNNRSSYEATVPKIKKLLKAYPHMFCRSTIYKDTDPFVVKKGLLEVGLKNYQLVAASKPISEDSEEEAWSSKESAALMRNFIEAEADQLLESIKKRDQLNINNFKKSGMGKLFHSAIQKKYFACGAGRTFAGVSTSGDVFPCHRFVGLSDFRIGTVFDNKLDRDFYLKSPLEKSEKCSLCPVKYHCGGGCMHDHLGATGSVIKPNKDICSLQKFVAEKSAALLESIDDDDKRWLEDIGVPTQTPCYYDF